LESAIQKTISEGNLIGNVDAVDENSILVSSEDGRTRYKIPKNNLQGFDDHQNSMCNKQSLKDSMAVNLKVLER